LLLHALFDDFILRVQRAMLKIAPPFLVFEKGGAVLHPIFQKLFLAVQLLQK
jgi:hypothetical protein